MQIAFTFNSQALQRLRYIQVMSNKSSRYAIPSDPSYEKVQLFLQRHTISGFPFMLISLLHATAVKKLAYPVNTLRFLKRSLLVTGGLYLALNPRHKDLEIRGIIGDFASGFSHDFGVGLTLLATSEMFDISIDEINPILLLQNQPVLDYAALLPNNQGLLQVEAKGVTSNESRSSARSDIFKKKQKSSNTVVLQSGDILSSEQLIKIGVIVQAACRKQVAPSLKKKKRSKRPAQSVLEIIDPEPDDNLKQSSMEHFIAGKYWHYAGIALFAGLPQIAEEFAQRANALSEGRQRQPLLTDYHFDENTIFYHRGRRLVGVQWQPSNLPIGNEDVWFYQAADLDNLQTLLLENRFPQTSPYHAEQTTIREEIAESLFSDGSYFGIGLHRQGGLHSLITDDDVDPEQQSLWMI